MSNSIKKPLKDKLDYGKLNDFVYTVLVDKQKTPKFLGEITKKGMRNNFSETERYDYIEFEFDRESFKLIEDVIEEFACEVEVENSNKKPSIVSAFKFDDDMRVHLLDRIGEETLKLPTQTLSVLNDYVSKEISDEKFVDWIIANKHDFNNAICDEIDTILYETESFFFTSAHRNFERAAKDICLYFRSLGI